MTKKITCAWNFGMEHSGEIKYRELSFPDGTILKIPMCDACLISHNRVLEIAKEHDCDGEKAVEIFCKENDIK